MVQKEINAKIKRMCSYLEFYDKYGYLPFEKKRISVTIVGEAFNKIKKKTNKSKYIENLILNDVS